ncbi:PREDICTED: protein yippee-like At3g08990 [Nicotiana attenuata]|uniref:protein yippee-like At3g08990 n=1 Tax=Nicotiana attenuata TaxID=49451 RepID=UPI0009055A77|nr:PREDICTED: protein yippee-like At3g08990 [Nicotiana attenuata]
MGRIFLVEYDEFPEEDFFLCRICKTRIGLVEDHVDNVEDERRAVFNKVFNVEVDKENHHKKENGKTVADTYCVKCGMLLGVKLITVPHPTIYFKQGRFLMKTDKLVYWNDDPMFLDEGNNEHDHDQD